MSSLRKQVRSKIYMDEIFEELELGKKPRYGRQEFADLGQAINKKYVGGVSTQAAIEAALTPSPVIAVYVDAIFATGSTAFTQSSDICAIGDVSDLDNYEPKVLVYGPLGGEFESVFEVGDFVYLDDEFTTSVTNGFIAAYIGGTWSIIEVDGEGEIISKGDFDDICNV